VFIQSIGHWSFLQQGFLEELFYPFTHRLSSLSFVEEALVYRITSTNYTINPISKKRPAGSWLVHSAA
jgi:hypothetical protein